MLVIKKSYNPEIISSDRNIRAELMFYWGDEWPSEDIYDDLNQVYIDGYDDYYKIEVTFYDTEKIAYSGNTFTVPNNTREYIEKNVVTWTFDESILPDIISFDLSVRDGVYGEQQVLECVKVYTRNNDDYDLVGSFYISESEILVERKEESDLNELEKLIELEFNEQDLQKVDEEDSSIDEINQESEEFDDYIDVKEDISIEEVINVHEEEQLFESLILDEYIDCPTAILSVAPINNDGRLLKLSVNLLNVSPGRHIGVAIFLLEKQTDGSYIKRGYKVLDVVSPSEELYNYNEGFTIENICFVLPGNLYKNTELRAKVIANYLDYNIDIDNIN